MEIPGSKAVAIVGISAELPSGSYSKKNLDYHTFFDFLLEKGQSYETVPNDRFDSERWHGEGLGHIITQKGSFLKDVPLFDHVEFGITTKDARNMSLSTRKLIEHSFLALLDSGIDYRGRNVGCYMSGTAFDMQGISEPDELEAVGSFAGYPYMIANKVSYHLDLRGPSIPVDTACSSSLTALHLAMQAIQAGDCESAVVGGCQLNFRLVDFIQYSQGSVLSSDGTCKPLDESANGFSRGEGVTVIVLKPLQNAMWDNDHVYATILGTGINSSGSLAPVSAPVASAQKEAMCRAFKDTGRAPKDVDYVELHATGTAAGDPTEANWVGDVFGQRESELLVGSVKGNIGHLEICAFLASLLKICAMFQSKLLPPTVNLTTPNPAIAWNRWNMRAPTEVTSVSADHQLLASIMSSGIGGSNGHVVLQSFHQATPTYKTPSHISHERPLLVLAGGLSPRSTSDISDLISKTWSAVASKGLEKYASTCSRRGRQMPWQTYAIMLNQLALTPFAKPVLLPRSAPCISYVFSGQGPQYIQMGSQLFETYPTFRESIQQMDVIYKKVTGHSIRSLGVFSIGALDNWNIWPISVTLPAIAMVQMAMYDLLSSVGIVPSVVVGHSAGETAMVYASGACSRNMALEISIARGIALETLEGLGGSMVALNCGSETAQSIIDAVMNDRSGILQIACYNSDSAVTLAGNESLLELAIGFAKERDVSAHKLRTKIAVHSEFVDHCKEIYCHQIQDIFDRYPGDHSPSVTTYSSTFNGSLFTESFTPEYFWHNVRRPVSFNQAIKSIINNHPGTAFVEISPHPVLSAYISDNGVETDHVISFMKRTRAPQPFSESHIFLQGVAKLSLIGYTGIDFHSLNDTQPSASEGAAYYPFARKYVPFRPEPPKTTLSARESQWCGPLLHPGLRLNAFTHPKLAEHIIMGEPILPAAGFLEMIFEAGAKLAWNVRFQSMLPLTDERLLPVTFHKDGPSWSVSSELQSSSSKKRIHAEGFMTPEAVLNAGKMPIVDFKRELQQIDISNFYPTLVHFAQYGPVYQRVSACWKSNKEALVEVRAYDEDLLDLDKYIVHPALLDACFHVIVHPMFTANADRSVYYLPMSVETVALYDPSFIRKTLPKLIYSHILYKSWDPAGITFDLSVTDTNGTILCQLLGFRIAQHKKTSDTSLFEHQAMFDGRHEIVYQPLMVTSPHTPSSNDGIHVLTPFKKEAKSRDTLTSMEAHTFIKNDCKDSLGEVLSFLHIQGGKKVIRILSIGIEFLDMIHTLTTYAESKYMLDIHVLAPREFIPISPSSSRIGRVLSSLPNCDVSGYASENRLDAFYDIILGRFPLMDGVNEQSLENDILPAVLPGGFMILSFGDGIANGSITGTSTVSHTVLRKSIDIPTPLYLTSSAEGQRSSHVPPRQELCLEPCKFGPQFADSDTAQNPPSIIAFHLDNVLAIRHEVQTLKDNETLWIQASQDIQGYAAIGLVRSIRKELVAKDIRFALFDTAWSEDERSQIVSSFSSSPYVEKEVFVDSSGTICVPRLIPASIVLAPRLTTSDPHLMTTTPRNQHCVASTIPIPLHHVPVRIAASSMELGGLMAIVGYVSAELGPTNWEPGAAVIGITSVSTMLSINSGLIMLCEHSLIPLIKLDAASPFAAAQCAITIFTAALAIGSRVLMQPDALRGIRVLITQDSSEDVMSRSLTSLLTLVGVSVVQTSRNMTPSIINDIRSCNVGLSGWTDCSDIEVISSILPDSARLFAWNSPQAEVFDLLARNQWVAGDILRDTHDLFCDFLEHEQKINNSCSALPSPSQERSRVTDDLFVPSQNYFLIGGLGSLGIRLALWMYENGARNLVLTSRRGYSSSLTESKDEMACRVLAYLQDRPDLRLRLEACDASSQLAMSNLFQNSDTPIGGCILMSVVLADRLFISHDESSFSVPFPAKVGALVALENAIEIPSLDFLVSISSAATLGNVGQTNYSSANTAVDGLLSKYQNAFSLIAPAIIDSSTISHGLDLMPDQRFREWLPWSMTCSELFACLADGIRTISQTKFSVYIPKFNWYQMKQHLGGSPIYDHLIYESTTTSNKPPAASKELLRSIITKTLDIDEEDFSSDIPLTSYGLDSLSAGRLSHSLKPFLQLSQLQLLADITLNHIEERIKDNCQNLPAPVEEPTLERQFNWKLLNQPGQSVVKLVHGEGIPLILVHGGSGNIVAFIALQERFKTPLWAIQHTPECPSNSLKEMAAFYFLKIKAAQPSGPYRIGGYSACCLLAIEIGYLLRNSGDRVVQMALLDHCPTLYSSPIFPLDNDTIRMRRASQTLITTAMDALLSVYSREPGVSRQKIGMDIKKAQEGEVTSDVIRNYVTFIHQFISITASFLIELCDIKAADHVDFAHMNRRLRDWTVELDVPLTLFVAENGIFKTIPHPNEEWTDFSWLGGGVINVPGGHFSMLECADLIKSLESGWRR